MAAHVDVHVTVRGSQVYVLIRFKMLNDLSLEQLVTGNVQSTNNNTICLDTDLSRAVPVLAMVK